MPIASLETAILGAEYGRVHVCVKRRFGPANVDDSALLKLLLVSRVKLLIYSHFLSPSIGGVETSVQTLAQGLAEVHGADLQREFAVTVVTQTPAGESDDSSFSFAVVRRPTVAKLWSLVRESDVIHIAGPSLAPLLFSFLSRRPVVVEHHGYQAICPNGILIYQPDGTICPGHFQARRYWKCWRCQNCQLPRHRSALSLLLTLARSWLVRRAAKNLAITRHVLERHNLPRTKIVYYGIQDPEIKGPSQVSAKNGPEKITFAFVGRFVPEKGIPVLLQAARQLMTEGEPFEVLLIGDGPERTGLQGIIDRDGIRNHVRITGYLAEAALIEALRDVQVVVMPSVWEETAGLAAMEQMMRGRLVIASDIGGLREIVGDTGLRFAPGNAAALAECMRLVLRRPQLPDEMGREARLRALRFFTRERMIDEHRHIYRETLSNAGS